MRDERLIGAFRSASGGRLDDGDFTSYEKCDSCGRIYELNLILTGGLGSRSISPERRKANLERRRISRSNELLFENSQNRCICDPKGDELFLEQRAVDSARRRLAQSRETPVSTRLGETGAVVSLVDQLRQLSDLFNAGALTREQFEAAKNALLGIQNQ